MGHLAVFDMATDLIDLEPTKVPQARRCLFDRPIDRFADALFRGADDFHDLVDVLRHLRAPLLATPGETTGAPKCCADARDREGQGFGFSGSRARTASRCLSVTDRSCGRPGLSLGRVSRAQVANSVKLLSAVGPAASIAAREPVIRVARLIGSYRRAARDVDSCNGRGSDNNKGLD